MSNNELLEFISKFKKGSILPAYSIFIESWILVNKYLLCDLVELGLWNDNLKNELIGANGSIKDIDIIPNNIKELYKGQWAHIDEATGNVLAIKNQDALDAFTGEGSIQAIQDYEWTDAPTYDLDYTGGSAYGTDTTAEGYEYDPDYIPEFFTGFNLEYDPGYKDPNMPAEWGGYGEGEGPSEDDEGGSVSSAPPGSAAPMQMMGPKKKTRIKAPTSVGLNPFSSGSASYR